MSAIEQLANSYNNFQQNYGQSQEKEVSQSDLALFADNFKKIINREEHVSSRAGLPDQLKAVAGFVGNWTIEPKFIIPSADQAKCTIRYIINTEKAGAFDVIAVMSSKDGKSIDAIDEVASKVV